MSLSRSAFSFELDNESFLLQFEALGRHIIPLFMLLVSVDRRLPVVCGIDSSANESLNSTKSYKGSDLRPRPAVQGKFCSVASCDDSVTAKTSRDRWLPLQLVASPTFPASSLPPPQSCDTLWSDQFPISPPIDHEAHQRISCQTHFNELIPTSTH